MKMTSMEKVFLDKIIADAGQDVTVIRSIVRAILISIIKEIYASYYNSNNKDDITTNYQIPYIVNMDINCKKVLTPDSGEKIKISIECTPSIILEKEVDRIFNETNLQMEDFFKQEITLTLMKYLDLDKDVIVDKDSLIE